LVSASVHIAAKIWTYTSKLANQIPANGELSPRMASCTREIRYRRHFPVTAARQTSFTANANQSNECTVTAHVPGKEVCRCHRGKKWFLPPWKLIFTTAELIFTTVAMEFYSFFLFFFHCGNSINQKVLSIYKGVEYMWVQFSVRRGTWPLWQGRSIVSRDVGWWMMDLALLRHIIAERKSQ